MSDDYNILNEAIEDYLLEESDPVMYRKSKDNGEITAVFPHKKHTADRHGHATAYAHVGQHGAAHPEWVEKETDAISHDHPDVKPLHKELVSRGYRPSPIHPNDHNKHIKRIKARMESTDLSEEIDTGQYPSAQDRKDAHKESPKQDMAADGKPLSHSVSYDLTNKKAVGYRHLAPHERKEGGPTREKTFEHPIEKKKYDQAIKAVVKRHGTSAKGAKVAHDLFHAYTKAKAKVLGEADYSHFEKLAKSYYKAKKQHKDAVASGSKDVSKLGGKVDDLKKAVHSHPINRADFWKSNPDLEKKLSKLADRHK